MSKDALAGSAMVAENTPLHRFVLEAIDPGTGCVVMEAKVQATDASEILDILAPDARSVVLAGAECDLEGDEVERFNARFNLAFEPGALAVRLRPVRDIEITVRAPDDCDDIAINATPLGMDAGDPLPFRVEQLGSAAIVADVVMKPPKTRLLELASQRGLRTQEGRHMLDNQVESIWEFVGLRR